MASLRRTLTLGAVTSIENAMKTRCDRGNLEVGVAYVQVNKTGRTKVGGTAAGPYMSGAEDALAGAMHILRTQTGPHMGEGEQ